MASVCRTTQTFMVEMGESLTSLADAIAAHHALVQAANRMSAAGADVRVLSSSFDPVAPRWVCLFTAADEVVARRTADLAQIPERQVRATINLSDVDRSEGTSA